MFLRVWLLIVVCGVVAACGAPPPQVLPTLVDVDPVDSTAHPAQDAAGTTVTPATQPPPRPLAFWQPATGALTTQNPINEWQFNANAGDAVTIRALGQGVAVTLALLDAADAVLLESEAVIQAVLPETGLYTVRLFAVSHTEYEIGLSYTDQANPFDVPPTEVPIVVGVPTPIPPLSDLGAYIGEIIAGDTAADTLTEADNLHVYSHQAAAGQYLTLELSRVSGEIEPFLMLYNPSGDALALDANSGINGARIRNVLLAEDGIYTIQVSGRGRAGVYALHLTAADRPQPVTPTVFFVPTHTPESPELTPVIAPSVQGERLEDHVPVRGFLLTPMDLGRHSFLAEAGETLSIGVLPLPDSPLIPHVELIDPDGVPVAVVSGEASPENRLALVSSFVTTLAGPYTAFITAEGETYGDYTISYGKGTTYRQVMQGAALVDQANEGLIASTGARDVWHVHLRQGDVVTAALTVDFNSTLNPVLELVSDTGELLGIDNSSGGERTPIINGVTITQSGLYFLRVRAAHATQSGAYTLTWRYLNVAATPTPPYASAPLLMMRDDVPENDYRFYPFHARTGQKIVIRVTGEDTQTFDPMLALLDPNGQTILEADDTGDSLNPMAEIEIPADGTYTVRVNGYLSGGTFDLVVEELVQLR